MSPRARSTGAKKFTWKTFCHSSSEVSMVPRRAPPSPFGEIPALLTSASSREPLAASRSRISATACMVLPASARSTTI
jgi:hypothetical protein